MYANPKKLNLSRDQAKELINQAAQVSKHVILTSHAKHRMDERNIIRRQIITALKSGTVINDPFVDLMHNTWKCTVQGFCAGDILLAQVAITKNEAGVTVITVYWDQAVKEVNLRRLSNVSLYRSVD